MPWIPEDQRDTRYYLWEKKFLCNLRYGDTFTIDRLKSQGIYTSGDQATDRAMMNTQTRFWLSINQMVDYFQQGIIVGVVERADTAKIYEYISNHIDAFRREIAMAFDLNDIPLDDLVILDEFATTVYEHAKHQFTKEVAHDLIARRMDALVGFTPDNILGEERKEPVATPTVPGAEEEEDDGYEKRNSLRDYFVRLSRNQHRGA
jgi:hypothetical protein